MNPELLRQHEHVKAVRARIMSARPRLRIVAGASFTTVPDPNSHVRAYLLWRLRELDDGGLKYQPVERDLKRIVVAVSEAFDVPVMHIYADRRTRREVRARHVAWWLARELTSLNTVEIARRFGKGRDHSSVIHGCALLDAAMREDPDVARDIQAVRMLLEAQG